MKKSNKRYIPKKPKLTKSYYKDFINRIIVSFKESGSICYLERCVLAYILGLPDDDRIDYALREGIKNKELIQIFKIREMQFYLDPVMF